MIAFVNGTVAYIEETSAVIDVNGVGYRVYMSPMNLGKLIIGETVRIHTYLRVAEDIMDLYGFMSAEELSMFKMIISVNGAGPKAGLAVLSVVSPAQFALAVVTDDIKTITRAQGVGPKLAQKIVLDLKDKLKNTDMLAGGESVSASDMSYSPAGGGNDAVEALMVLGYTQGEALRAVSSVKGENLSTEETIRQALQLLMK